MFEEYRNRIARTSGAYMGDTMRKQTRFVTDQLWLNTTTAHPVCVHSVQQGLPPMYQHIEDFNEALWAHFESHKNYNVGSNAVDYLLTFQPQVVAEHPAIKIGSYVSIPNIYEIPEYWLIVNMEEKNDLIQCRVLKCNWQLKWITNGVIYTTLGVFRGGSSDADGIEDEGNFTSVDSSAAIWLPTNSDTQSIGVNTRFLISDNGRVPPQAWEISRIVDVSPVGVTKLTLIQRLYNDTTDNAELMIADYFTSEIEPTPSDPEAALAGTASITYNGSRPTIKVGGSYKVFTPVFSNADTVVSKWTISDENGDISTNSNYIIERDGELLKLKVALDYNLVGTVLIIQLVGSDNSTTELKVEVVS